MKKPLLLIISFIFSITVYAQVDNTTLETILTDYIGEDDTGMVIYILDNGTSATAALGAADFDTGETVTADDLFRIGSTTKPMVATVILSLVDEGLIALDDPIADYLPDEVVSRVANADVATVRQMLQMTSGIFSYTDSDAFDDAVFDNPTYGWTAAEVIEYVYDEEADFDAGIDYYYSNSNYILAELIIEQVSSMSLAEALDSMIFDVAGMDSCYLETPDRFGQGIVQGYALGDDDEFYNVTLENDGVGLGDGGVICNAEDLAKFPVALWNGDLISDDMLDEMLETVDDGEGGQYGLGIGYDDTEYGMVLSHDGATSGFQSTMQYLPDEDIVVTILTNNFDSEIVEDVLYDVLDAAFDE